MNKDVMNQGVQILLDRMDTNPEEFEEGNYSKWADIIGAVTARVKEKTEGKDYGKPLPFLSDPEVSALYDKLEDVRRENFTADVMRRLANAPQELEQGELWEKPTYSMSNQPVLGTPVTTGTWGASTTGKINLSQVELSSMTDRQKELIADAVDEIKRRRHEDLHKELELAIKKEKKRASLRKAVK